MLFLNKEKNKSFEELVYEKINKNCDYSFYNHAVNSIGNKFLCQKCYQELNYCKSIRI